MALILLIEDDEEVLAVLSEGLRIAGHTVVEATDGSAGILYAKGNQVDVLITDIIMPGMEGLETISALKASYPGLKIIAMSGGGTVGPSSYLSLASAFGAERTLAKPFPLRDLIEAVAELTGDRSSSS